MNAHRETARFQVMTGDRPVTLNAERRSNRWRRSEAAKAWKHAAIQALTEYKLHKLRLERVDILIRPFYPPKSGNLPDTGGLYPTEKAIVDALVEAEVIPDDNRHHVRAITSQAPDVWDRAPCPLVVVQLEPKPPAAPHPPRSLCGCRRHPKGTA